MERAAPRDCRQAAARCPQVQMSVKAAGGPSPLGGGQGKAPARQAAAWWIKCDPTSGRHHGWNWPDLFREYRAGKPYLWSVGPALSQRNARLAKPGDPVFGYAAGEGHRALLALAEVERAGV